MSNINGSASATGAIQMQVFKGTPARELRLLEIFKLALPWLGLTREVFLYRLFNFFNVWRGLWRVLTARAMTIPHFYGTVSARVFRGDGTIVDYGVISLRLVTTVGVNYIVDAFQNLTELENLKFHGFGTGAGAEAIGNTTLGTELTTAYNPDSTRPTGTTVEGASANIFRTVATLTPDAAAAITEHGIFSQAATGGGTLLDRSLFSAVNLEVGDSLQITYDFTVNAGG